MGDNTSRQAGYLTPTSAPVAEDDALDDIFQAFIVGITGLPPDMVRPRWQPFVAKSPAVTANWCAIGVVSDTPDSNAVVVHNGAGDGSDELQRHEELRVLATFYGPNAKGFAKQARDGIYIEQNRFQLSNMLLAVIATDTIRAVPEYLNEQWIRRYDLPIRFRRLIKRTYGVENILTDNVIIIIDP